MVAAAGLQGAAEQNPAYRPAPLLRFSACHAGVGGAARAPSPDVRCGRPRPPLTRRCRRSGILPTLATYAGSRGTGSPAREHRERHLGEVGASRL